MGRDTQPNRGASENAGLHLGHSLRGAVPTEFGNGLHLGQWLRDDGGLHLGQTLRGPEPPPPPRDLIINGDFNAPGVGSWSEDTVPGWYVPTDGAFQDVVISTGLFGATELFAQIPLTEATPGVPAGYPPSYFGEVAQNVEAVSGETYTLRWDAWFNHAQLGPHVDGVLVVWNGDPVIGTEVSRSADGPAYWASFQATVVGQEGTDTLAFRSELFTSGPGSRIDHISLVGPPDTVTGGWFA